MPYLSVTTNQSLGQQAKQEAVLKLSQACAEMLAKPESYMMVSLHTDQCMSFAGNSEPCAMVSLASLGLPSAKTSDFSMSLCGLISDICGVNCERIYIQFTSPERHMWGWNQTTF